MRFLGGLLILLFFSSGTSASQICDTVPRTIELHLPESWKRLKELWPYLSELESPGFDPWFNRRDYYEIAVIRKTVPEMAMELKIPREQVFRELRQIGSWAGQDISYRTYHKYHKEWSPKKMADFLGLSLEQVYLDLEALELTYLKDD